MENSSSNWPNLAGARQPGEAPARGTSSEKASVVASKPKGSAKASAAATPSADQKLNEKQQNQMPPLNINLQIHIGADATSEQIESIFSAMRRYLYENPAS